MLLYLTTFPQPSSDYDFIITDNGAWTWYNDERAIAKHNRLYTSYVRNDGCVTLAVTDLSNGVHIGVEVILSTWTETDDHNNACILLREDGKIMTFYTRHGTQACHSYRTSLVNEPHLPWEWGPEITEPSPGNATYNNAFQLSGEGGRIYNFMRTEGANPHWIEYDAQGNPFANERMLIKNPSHNPYVKYTSNNIDRIDFFFTDGHPRHDNNNLYHFYYSDGAYYQTNGAFIKNKTDAPVFPHEASRIYSFGVDHPTARPWTHSINYDSLGNPVVTYSLQKDIHNITYHMARWEPGSVQWLRTYVADAGDGLYGDEPDYTGLLVTNPNNVDEIFMSSNVNPITNSATMHYEIYKGIVSNNGNSISWTAITENSNTDNLRPFIPKGVDDENQILLWFTGRYCTYKDYNTKVVGKFIHKTFVPDGSIPQYNIEETSIKIYPNPIVDKFYVELGFPAITCIRAELINAQGRRVAFIRNGNIEGDVTHRFELDGSQLPNGVYAFYVATDDGFLFKKRMLVVK